jgi:predicted DNA-binding protein
MLLEPEQRKKLVALAKAQGKSIAEITRLAIDAGLEKLAQNEQQVRMNAALKAAQQLRESMPMLAIDVAADLHQMREERDNDLFRRD